MNPTSTPIYPATLQLGLLKTVIDLLMYSLHCEVNWETLVCLRCNKLFLFQYIEHFHRSLCDFCTVSVFVATIIRHQCYLVGLYCKHTLVFYP
jgi:hypothetical protein